MTRNEARRWRERIENAAKHLPDDEALASVELFPSWDANAAYAVGDRIRYADVLYKIITAHTAQEAWKPDISPSLYARIAEPSDWPEWIQPTSAETAYNIGDKVSHNNKHWICTIDANVWEPGVYGWDEVTE